MESGQEENLTAMGSCSHHHGLRLAGLATPRGSSGPSWPTRAGPRSPPVYQADRSYGICLCRIHPIGLPYQAAAPPGLFSRLASRPSRLYRPCFIVPAPLEPDKEACLHSVMPNFYSWVLSVSVNYRIFNINCDYWCICSLIFCKCVI
jgi:hypothetical protein